MPVKTSRRTTTWPGNLPSALWTARRELPTSAYHTERKVLLLASTSIPPAEGGPIVLLPFFSKNLSKKRSRTYTPAHILPPTPRPIPTWGEAPCTEGLRRDKG